MTETIQGTQRRLPFIDLSNKDIARELRIWAS